MYYSGSIRIRNPKTLQKWIDKGWHLEELENGYEFSVGCGRYTNGKCNCTKCRKSKNSPLKKVLEDNGF